MSSNGPRMTDQTSTQPATAPECRAFAQQLGDYLEGELAAPAQHIMDAHRRTCSACHALAGDIGAMVEQAGALPVMTPSRDLWSGIESRLATDVIPLPSRLAPTTTTTTPSTPMRRTVSVRLLAVAAALLVTVSSAVTWRVARVRPQQGQAQIELAQRLAPAVPSDNAIESGIDNAVDIADPREVDDAIPATLAAVSPADVDMIYEREIKSLRAIVNERFAELDSSTVVALRRNLAIIDAAIADSRTALDRDPNSRLLSSQLDRALESKLALMRRVALL